MEVISLVVVSMLSITIAFTRRCHCHQCHQAWSERHHRNMSDDGSSAQRRRILAIRQYQSSTTCRKCYQVQLNDGSHASRLANGLYWQQNSHGMRTCSQVHASYSHYSVKFCRQFWWAQTTTQKRPWAKANELLLLHVNSNWNKMAIDAQSGRVINVRSAARWSRAVVATAAGNVPHRRRRRGRRW